MTRGALRALRIGIALFTGSAPSLVLAQSEPVRVSYRAPEICPSEEAFLERVRSRTDGATFAASGGLARSFEVRVIRLQNENELLGQLEFVDRDGRHALRSLRGSACDQLASSLALITALAIDDRIAEAPPDDVSPPPSPSPVAPRAPPPPPQVDNAQRAAPPRLAEPEPALRAGKSAQRLHWELGGTLGALTWITRRGALGFGIYAELGSSSHGWSVRLSGFDSRRSLGEEGRRADFSADWLRLEACPVSLPLARHVSLSPCLGFDAGQLRAQAPSTQGSTSTGPQSIAWAAANALARLRWVVGDRLSLGLDGELAAPLVGHRFSFVESDDSHRTLLEVPALGVGVKFGVGVRFP